MLGFLTDLFDTSGFPPRWHCGDWSDAHGWLHILSDLAIWMAYFAIPCVLVYFVRRRRDVPFANIFWLFGAFILACGTTHLMEAIIFWHPVYRLAGVIKLVTAVVSWGTVAALVPIFPKALAMRSPEELEREIIARKKAENALQQANAELERRVQQRTEELAHANAALEKERDRFQTTLSSIGDAVITTDLEGRVTFLNDIAKKLTGWPKDEAIGQPLASVFQIVNEQTRLPVANPVSRVIRDGMVVSLANHTTLIAKDSREFPIDDSAAPIRDGWGQVVGVVLVFRNVQERRQDEYELRKNQEVLQLAHSIAKIGHWEWNSLTDENKWSPEIQTLYGLKPGTFAGTYDAWAKLVHPDDLPKAEEDVRQAMKTGKYFAEFRVIWPDGSVHWLEARATVFKDGHDKPVRIMGVNMDITERKQAEEAVRASERREKERAAELEAIMRATPTAIWIAHDPQCHQITGNAASYALLNMPEGCNSSATPADGKSPYRRHQEYRDGAPVPAHELPVQVAAAQGVEVKAAELSLVFHDGAVRHILGNAVPIRTADGKVSGAIAAFMDVTEMKEAEQALKNADRRKNEFLATLAHELRNPLAPIRNGIELLRRAQGNAAIIDQARTIMERQVGQMVRLVDDLLDIARITNGKLQLRKERVQLAALVRSAVEASRPHIEAQSHELTITLPDEPIYLDADPTRLSQVISNLLNNAAKFTEKGGHIWLTAEHQPGAVTVTVRDTGIGIPSEHLPHIFQMFSQVAPALERSQAGLGIGLALVKGLVELHGGAIEAHSSPGKGSEFIVRLPVIEAQIPRPTPKFEDGPPTRSGSALLILVADDNQDAADSLTMMLRMMGHEVQTTHDGVEAVQAAATFRPDVVLLDIGMPKLNGYEAARAIREQPWGRRMVLIALTGWGQEEDKRRATEAGFHYHLTKPVEPGALEKLLESLTLPRNE